MLSSGDSRLSVLSSPPPTITLCVHSYLYFVYLYFVFCILYICPRLRQTITLSLHSYLYFQICLPFASDPTVRPKLKDFIAVFCHLYLCSLVFCIPSFGKGSKKRALGLPIAHWQICIFVSCISYFVFVVFFISLPSSPRLRLQSHFACCTVICTFKFAFLSHQVRL